MCTTHFTYPITQLSFPLPFDPLSIKDPASKAQLHIQRVISSPLSYSAQFSNNCDLAITQRNSTIPLHISLLVCDSHFLFCFSGPLSFPKDTSYQRNEHLSLCTLVHYQLLNHRMFLICIVLFISSIFRLRCSLHRTSFVLSIEFSFPKCSAHFKS